MPAIDSLHIVLFTAFLMAVLIAWHYWGYKKLYGEILDELDDIQIPQKTEKWCEIQSRDRTLRMFNNLPENPDPKDLQ